MRKIAVITGSRAEHSPLSKVIVLLGDGCIHIQTEGLFGHENTIRSKLEEIKPDLVLLLGDRYECLVAASVAALLAIPICHVHGGEETIGAVDNAFRHAITKLSYYHFCAHEDYARRIIQMGESPDRVFVVGAPGVDQYAGSDKESLHAQERPFALVCYHSETLGNDIENLNVIADQIRGIDNFWISSVNEDIGNLEIKKFWGNMDIEMKSCSPAEWIRLMKSSDVLIGNSSCFIIEGMTLGKKVINIGDRQKGRYEEALKHFADNPFAYGKPGEVSPRIVELLMTLPIPEKPRKEWYDPNNKN